MAVSLNGELIDAGGFIKAIVRGMEGEENGFLARAGITKATMLRDDKTGRVGVRLVVTDRPYKGSIWVIATENAGHFTVAVGDYNGREWIGQDRYFDVPADGLNYVIAREVFGPETTPVAPAIPPIAIHSHP